MREFFFLFLQIEASLVETSIRPIIVRDQCPDEDLALICDGHCYSDYIVCKENCESSGCERGCLSDYTACYDSCPCFSECENGCAGCGNSICTCSSPQTDNTHYQQCVKETLLSFNDCVGNCTASMTCYDDCYANFTHESKKCPCMPECELGCPCNGGFHCEEYTTLLCQDVLTLSYVISASGTFKENRVYNSPPPEGNQFIKQSGFALLNGIGHIFGGLRNRKQIIKIMECSLVDTEMSLIYDFESVDGSIVTVREIHDEIVLCPNQNCETFDGLTSVSIAKTRENHKNGAMCLYEGQAFIIGGWTSTSSEALQLSGWQLEPAYPIAKTFRISCTSLDDGIIVAGGYSSEDGFIKDVYLFRDKEWTKVGKLNYKFAYASMINYGNYFIIFGGASEDFVVEKADWDGEKITSSEKINDHEGKTCYRPIVFQSDPDSCSSPCLDSYCYQF